MRWRNTALLLVIFALLAGYVYFFELKREEPPKFQFVQVLELEKDQIKSLEVQDNEGGKAVKVVKGEDGVWRMEKPFSAEADQNRLEGLIGRVAQLRASRMFTEELNLADFGLAEPAYTVRIGLADGSEYVLQVGDENPQGSGYYLRKEGEEGLYLVYLGTINDLKRLITRPPEKPTPTPTPTSTSVAESQPSPAVTPTATPTPSS